MSALPVAPAQSRASPRPPDSRWESGPCRPGGRTRQAGACLAAFLLLATLLGTGRLVVAVGGGWVVPGWPGSTDASAAGPARQFYDALDDALAGRGDDRLAAATAPDAVVRAPDGSSAPGGVAARLAALRQTGGLALTVRSLVVDGDRVAVRLDLTTTPQTAWPDLGLPAGGVLWSGTEVLRIAGGRVAEWWPAPLEAALPIRAPVLTTRRLPGRVELSLVRFRLEPGASLPDLAGPADHLIVPEQGAVMVQLGGAAQAWHGDGDWQPTDRQGQTVALGPGDALMVPAEVEHTVRNPTGAPATLLGLALLPVESLRQASSPVGDRVVSLAAIHGFTPLGPVAPAYTPQGVAATHLAVAFDGCDSAVGVAVRLGRLPLRPGATLPPHDVAGQELLVPEQGGLTLDDPAWRVGAGAAALPGRAFAVADGPAPRLATTGPLASRVLVLDLAPIPVADHLGPPAVREGCAGA